MRQKTAKGREGCRCTQVPLCVFMPPISSTLKPVGIVSERGWGEEKKKKKHNKTTNDKKKKREKNNNSLYRIYMITSLTQAEIPEAPGLHPQVARPHGERSRLAEDDSWSQQSLSINYLHACFAFWGAGDFCVCVCVWFFLEVQRNKQKSLPTCFYKKQCSREKVLYGSLCTEVGSELQKLIFFPSF